jgi:hypothetical protein
MTSATINLECLKGSYVYVPLDSAPRQRSFGQAIPQMLTLRRFVQR